MLAFARPTSAFGGGKMLPVHELAALLCISAGATLTSSGDHRQQSLEQRPVNPALAMTEK
jgi:hypothetical protein